MCKLHHLISTRFLAKAKFLTQNFKALGSISFDFLAFLEERIEVLLGGEVLEGFVDEVVELVVFRVQENLFLPQRN